MDVRKEGWQAVLNGCLVRCRVLMLFLGCCFGSQAEQLKPISFGYAYSDANHRTRVSHADGTYWLYEYDKLGQVTSGKKYWEDGTPVAGEQFEYAFDDIGNRTSTEEGGNAVGA